MEKREIKINLVGAICVFIIIIVAIVGLIIGIPKLINNSKNNIIAENTKDKIDENKEYIERITDKSGNVIESKMKICNSNLGYTMKYDYEKFTVEKNIEETDRYISLFSNTIGITIQKAKGRYSRLSEYLNKNYQSDRVAIPANSQNEVKTQEEIELEKMFRRLSERIDYSNIKSFNTTKIVLNDRDVMKRTIEHGSGVDYVYCVKIDEENFYVIHVYCGKEFTDSVLLVMENMVNTFTFAEE